MTLDAVFAVATEFGVVVFAVAAPRRNSARHRGQSPGVVRDVLAQRAGEGANPAVRDQSPESGHSLLGIRRLFLDPSGQQRRRGRYLHDVDVAYSRLHCRGHSLDGAGEWVEGKEHYPLVDAQRAQNGAGPRPGACESWLLQRTAKAAFAIGPSSLRVAPVQQVLRRHRIRDIVQTARPGIACRRRSGGPPPARGNREPEGEIEPPGRPRGLQNLAHQAPAYPVAIDGSPG